MLLPNKTGPLGVKETLIDAPVTIEEIEHLLGRLTGVLSARLVINDWGAIEEIHVLASSQRAPKQVVRDVESTLAARWGLRVDHKKISVAQLTGQNMPIPPLRVKLLNVQVTVDSRSGHTQAMVKLGRSDAEEESHEGTADGNASRTGFLRSVVGATLVSLNHMVESPGLFALDDVITLTMSGRELVVVTLVLYSPRRYEECLVGAVAIKGDLANSVVKATLDAANRRLPKVAKRVGQ